MVSPSLSPLSLPLLLPLRSRLIPHFFSLVSLFHPLFEVLHDLSQLLNTGLTREQLAVCVEMVDQNIHPEAVAVSLLQMAAHKSCSRFSLGTSFFLLFRTLHTGNRESFEEREQEGDDDSNPVIFTLCLTSHFYVSSSLFPSRPSVLSAILQQESSLLSRHRLSVERLRQSLPETKHRSRQPRFEDLLLRWVFSSLTSRIVTLVWILFMIDSKEIPEFSQPSIWSDRSGPSSKPSNVFGAVSSSASLFSFSPSCLRLQLQPISEQVLVGTFFLISTRMISKPLKRF